MMYSSPVQVVNAVVPNPSVAAEFFAGPDDGPFVMVNLLRFRASAAMVLSAMATDRGGRQGVSMNGAGNIAGLLTDVLPAATVVEQMPIEAAARLAIR